MLIADLWKNEFSFPYHLDLIKCESEKLLRKFNLVGGEVNFYALGAIYQNESVIFYCLGVKLQSNKLIPFWVDL